MKKQYLMDNLGVLRQDIANAFLEHRPVLILLDYDGTLVPIRRSPELAIATAAQIGLLNRLANDGKTLLGIVTGRSLRQIRSLLPIHPAFFVANHGLQIYLKRDWQHPKVRSFQPLIHDMLTQLQRRLSAYKGVLVEDKKVTLSIHFRNAHPALLPKIRNIAIEAVAKFPGKFILRSGKKVLEIHPDLLWNKGLGVEKAIAMMHFPVEPMIICFGDDRTDEDMFSALRSKGTTVAVGRRAQTSAQYYLSNHVEVQKLLQAVDWLSRRGRHG